MRIMKRKALTLAESPVALLLKGRLLKRTVRFTQERKIYMTEKHRLYDSSLNSELQALSPFRIQGMNRYMYVEGNPVKYNDPSGHKLSSAQSYGLFAYIIGQQYNLNYETVVGIAIVGRHQYNKKHRNSLSNGRFTISDAENKKDNDKIIRGAITGALFSGQFGVDPLQGAMLGGIIGNDKMSKSARASSAGYLLGPSIGTTREDAAMIGGMMPQYDKNNLLTYIMAVHHKEMGLSFEEALFWGTVAAWSHHSEKQKQVRASHNLDCIVIGIYQVYSFLSFTFSGGISTYGIPNTPLSFKVKNFTDAGQSKCDDGSSSSFFGR